ncbi:trypsin-like peptidase domain-containing protein [Streptomyces sp. ND04-05B]|uniref:VMAP-C domain-containing protein n=1 Tax=Streptomyces sp. ND04-05B TaxID=3028693 RepID=UPI0029B75DD5|nr:trypsin-like peptidase domain-containing protein [Streptomyces sp. ND04-05B]MDX3068611.1 trypsin-like peptidase domain-containing protein [Streptomyces sp. ND04-05B]
MTSAGWHAKVECAGNTGAGFLITAHHVLTCAHVVKDSDSHQVCITFAGGGGTPLTGRVVARGDWDGTPTSRGDVAVLELGRPVDLRPARFATASEAYGDPPPKLLVHGFPRHNRRGILTEYRTTADHLLDGEWIQLEAWKAYGQPLAPGFSGAALTLTDGRVVGLVTSAAKDPGIRDGRMLPAHVVARYWAPLAELIPNPVYTENQLRRLRQLIEDASQQDGLECSPERLYRDAVGIGPPPPDGLNSLWDAVWYLLFEVPDPDAVARFAGRLAIFVDDLETRRGLRAWSQAASGSTTPSQARQTHDWSPILVEIAPSGRGDNHFLVEVSAYNGQDRLVVGSSRLPVESIRPYALERIDEAYHVLEPAARELIAFVLPLRYLNLGVAQWQRSPDDDSPLGSFAPLVVISLERRRSFGLQHKLRQKWARLDTLPMAQLHRIGCASLRQSPKGLTIGLHRSTDVVGFGTPPRADGVRRLLKATLNAPAPAVLWPRNSCKGGALPHDDCQGTTFLNHLDEHLAGRPLRDLPAYVHELREAACSVEDATEPSAVEKHWAHDLTLLWEDPRCLPDPDSFRELPV